MTKETVNKAPSGRPVRKPVGYRNRLAAPDVGPEFVARWVNAAADGGQRVEILEQAGYEKVLKSANSQNGNRVDDASVVGSVLTTPGGGGDMLVLMKQKKEYYEEDQVAKQTRVDELDAAQKKTPDGLYGKITSN